MTPCPCVFVDNSEHVIAGWDFIDIFIAVETNINDSFYTAQFGNDGFQKALRLDVTSGVLWLYVSLYLFSRQLSKHEIPSNIQTLAFEINLRKKK